jgi:hypothetical protein
MIQLALRSALSDRASEDRVMVMAEWPWTEPKTALAREALIALGLEGRILIVLDRNNDEEAYKSFRNLPLAQVILTGELNAYDILCNDWIVFTKATLPGKPAAEGSDEIVAEVAEEIEAEVEAEIEAEIVAEVVEEIATEIEAEIEAEFTAEVEAETAEEFAAEVAAEGETEGKPEGAAHDEETK